MKRGEKREEYNDASGSGGGGEQRTSASECGRPSSPHGATQGRAARKQSAQQAAVAKAGKGLRQGRHKSGNQPLREDLHDLLVIDELERLYRFPFNEVNGFRPTPDVVGDRDEGERKVAEVAGSHRKNGSATGFALLPVRPNPASAFFCCYLVHTPFFLSGEGAQRVQVDLRDRERSGKRQKYSLGPHKVNDGPVDGNITYSDGPLTALGVSVAKNGTKVFDVDSGLLDFVNPWTVEDWSGSAPRDRAASLVGTDPWGLRIVWRDRRIDVVGGACSIPKAFSIPRDAILGTSRAGIAFLNLEHVPEAATLQTLLLALDDGTVRELRWDRGSTSITELPELPLKENAEVWRLLRNGCVLGRARTDGGEDALLLNLSSLTRPEASKRELLPVSGTLDFKWSTQRKLVVRFIQPHPDVEGAEVARRHVLETFQAWTADTGLELDLPKDEAQDLPFDPKETEHTRVDYDILISLDPLALIPATETDPERLVGLPVSDLGTYALRRSYGSPTMLLGQPYDGRLAEMGMPEYFASPEFKHFVVHEVGHALGLPHLHQTPGLGENLKRKPLDEIRAELMAVFGFELDADFVNEELLREWSDRGARPAAFSEWLSVEDIAASGNESVMLGFPGVALFDGPWKDLGLRSAPGELDHQWIQALYPQRHFTSQVSPTAR